MCGRYASNVDSASERAFKLRGRVKPFASYNIAATHQAPVIVKSAEGGRELVLMRWGFIPSWGLDTPFHNHRIHAEAETMATSTTFGEVFRRRRCLVPALAYYEWERHPPSQWPYLVRHKDGSPLVFAGLWDSRHDVQTKQNTLSFAIVMTQANRQMAAFHNRMPAILAAQDYETWLSAEPKAAGTVIKPYPASLHIHRVSVRVNKLRHNDPKLFDVASDSEGDGLSTEGMDDIVNEPR